MYKVIGANRIEYGPVDAAQVRLWITEGRLVAESLIRHVEQETWQTLGTVPEFAASFSGVPPVFPTTPPSGSTPPPPGPTPFTPGVMSSNVDPRQHALQEVNGPVIGLIITAALGFLAGGGGVLSGFGRTFARGMRHGPFGRGGFGPGFNSDDFNSFADVLMTPFSIGTGIVHMVLAAVVIWGGIKMMKLENHGLAVSAAVIALIPCISPCCCIGLPIGIWALTVLNRPEIKSQFK